MGISGTVGREAIAVPVGQEGGRELQCLWGKGEGGNCSTCVERGREGIAVPLGKEECSICGDEGNCSICREEGITIHLRNVEFQYLWGRGELQYLREWGNISTCEEEGFEYQYLWGGGRIALPVGRGVRVAYILPTCAITKTGYSHQQQLQHTLATHTKSCDSQCKKSTRMHCNSPVIQLTHADNTTSLIVLLLLMVAVPYSMVATQYPCME